MSNIIFSSENIEVFFRPGNSTYALLAFGPATQLANGKTFWGQSVAERADLCAVGVMARRANWFPQKDIEEAREIIRSHVVQYKHVIGYGSSMGGYAVLKYGKFLGITDGLSFAPQWSISPDDVGNWDKRFIHNFRKSLHKGMSIREGDAPERCVVFYDPFFEEDKLNFLQIQKHAPSVLEVRAYLTGHYPITSVRGSENALRMFTFLLAGDLDSIRRATTIARRDPALALRAPFIAEIVSRKNPDGALRIHEKYEDRFDSGHSFLLFHKLTGIFIELGRYDDAVRFSDICLGAGELARDPFIRRSILEERRGNIAAAYKYANEAVQRWPVAATKMHLANLLVNEKKLADAVSLLHTILEKEPENLAAIRLMLRLTHELQNNKACDELIERLLSLDKSPDTCVRVGNIYFDRNRLDVAEEFFTKSVSTDPGYVHGWQRLASLYIMMPNWRKAIEAAESCILHQPSAPEGYRYLARAYKGLGFTQKSVLAEAEANKRMPKASPSPAPGDFNRNASPANYLSSEGSALKKVFSHALSFLSGKKLMQRQ